MYSIVIIGTGNTAANIGQALAGAGHKIFQIFGRNKKVGLKLAQRFGTEFISQVSKIRQDADFYIIAVKDDEIKNVSESIPVVNGIVLHTSGSVSIDALSNHHKRGVLYPLQSLKKSKPASLKNVPLLIEYSGAGTYKKTTDLASSVSNVVKKYSSGDRLKIHLAAVIVNNFTNHLYTLAWDFLLSEKIKPEILLPLIRETVTSLETEAPEKNQTGPARRNDNKTLKIHTQLLKNDKNLLKIYQVLSNSISEMYATKKKNK